MSIFQIAPLNPIRFIDLDTSESWPVIYHSKPFDLETYKESIFDFQTDRCFFQKYQTNDSAQVQIWSDFVPTCKVYNVTTGLNYTVTVTDTGITFPDFTFLVYEIDFNFAAYGEGLCYIEIKYTNVTDFVYLSEPIDLKLEWENTVFIEAKNDENAFSIIFDTDFVVKLRVDAILDNFTPKADRIIYNDQVRNNTLLYGVSYREFRLNIGGRQGIADWMIDKINRILACDEVSIDGEYYTVADGADWEPNRGEDYPLVGWRININPVENRFNQRLKPGFNEDGDEIQMILHANNRTDIAGDQSYTGIFNRYSVLHGLGIIKASIPDLNILIGTTVGGFDISGPEGFDITEANQFILINWVFDADANVYITVPIGGQLDINLYYYLPYDTATGGVIPPGPPPTFVKGTVYMYEEVSVGDFSIDWDETTGLGNIGTSYEGCALMDGRNGCGNMMGRTPVMYGSYTEESGVYSVTRGQQFGEAKHKLITGELPQHSHPLTFGKITSQQNTASADAVTNIAGTGLANSTTTGQAGGNDYHENRQPSFGIVFFKRIIA